MDAQQFANTFAQLYGDVYHLAARRLAQGQQRLSNETTGLLLHLAQAGPLTLAELSAHLSRAPSTLSVKVSALVAEGLLARQVDANDARSALIYLSPSGRQALTEALSVLDTDHLSAAAASLSPDQRQALTGGLQSLLSALSSCPQSIKGVESS